MVNDNDDLLLITDTGTIIRTPAEGIPVYSRTASGVIVMRLSEEASLVNFTTSEKAEEEETEEEASEAVENAEAVAEE